MGLLVVGAMKGSGGGGFVTTRRLGGRLTEPLPEAPMFPAAVGSMGGSCSVAQPKSSAAHPMMVSNCFMAIPFSCGRRITPGWIVNENGEGAMGKNQWVAEAEWVESLGTSVEGPLFSHQ